MGLTQEQADIITATVPILQEHGSHITTVFYATVLRENPSLNNLFNQANQANGHQAQALAAALYAYAANINNLDVLKPALERIEQKHVSLYIRPEQYDIVGKYLLAAMQEVLGDALTPPILEAWQAAYTQLADLMIAREAQLYAECDGWTDWRDMKIARRVDESDEVTSFYLEPCNGMLLPPFLPGQYISVRTEVPGQPNYTQQARQYSLSQAPQPDHYRISVKRDRGLDDTGHPDAPSHPGCVSNILHERKQVGDTVQVSHPAGDFFLNVRDDDEKSGPVVLLSAGVGLTPLMSILDTLVMKHDSRQISWVHATRNSKVQAFGEYVRDLAARENGHVRKEVFHSLPAEGEKRGEDYEFAGRMDLQKLDSRDDLMLFDDKARHYICGPGGFMTDLERALKGRGVPPERINMEVFGTGAAATA